MPPFVEYSTFETPLLSVASPSIKGGLASGSLNSVSMLALGAVVSGTGVGVGVGVGVAVGAGVAVADVGVSVAVGASVGVGVGVGVAVGAGPEMVIDSPPSEQLNDGLAFDLVEDCTLQLFASSTLPISKVIVALITPLEDNVPPVKSTFDSLTEGLQPDMSPPVIVTLVPGRFIENHFKVVSPLFVTVNVNEFPVVLVAAVFGVTDALQESAASTMLWLTKKEKAMARATTIDSECRMSVKL